MLVPHQLSQGSFGRVLSVRDDKTDQVALRPIDGKTKVITYTEDDVVVNITPRDEQAAQTFGAMQISLGSKTWDKLVSDIDPLWQQWDDEGLITEELLADVPQPEPDPEMVFNGAKATKAFAIDSWLKDQDNAGISVGDFNLKSDANSATQLSVYLSMLTPGVDTILVSDTENKPHIIEWQNLQSLVDTFKTEFNRRRLAWATAKASLLQSTTIEEVDAIELPK